MAWTPAYGFGGANTPGTPNVKNYALGRGKLLASDLSSSVPDGNGFRNLGNVVEFKISVSTEKLEHFSTASGTKTKDKEVTLSLNVSISFKLDEESAENLALWAQGTTATYTNAAIAGFAEHSMIAAVKRGRWYPIKSGAGVRAYGIASGDITVEKSGAPDTALVLGTDYLLDTGAGLIFFIVTSGGTLADGDTVDVTLAAAANAPTITETRALTQTSSSKALKFIGVNPADGDKVYEVDIHSIQLSPSGDLSLIGDTWMEMTYEGTAEKNETADANAPYYRIRAAA